jgi:hypothetical protein
MKGRFQSILLLLFLSFAVARGQALAAEPEVKYVEAATLKGMLGDPSLVIIDTSQGWWTYDQKIVGSFIYPEEASSWASRLPKDKTIVLYCG